MKLVDLIGHGTESAGIDESGWEVRQPPGRSGMRKLNTRTRIRVILAVAASAAIAVNAGAAWAYWTITGSDTGRSGVPVELALRGRSDLGPPLYPGRAGDLNITVVNDHDFPVRITSVSRGVGNIVADDEHRDSGCTRPPVDLIEASFAVDWRVDRNTIGTFTIPGGLVAGTGADRACQGATFTVPVQASGVRLSS